MKDFDSAGWQPFDMPARCDPLAALVASDWIRDRGGTEIEAGETIEPPTWVDILPADYYGRGSGIGSGIGSGRGSGIGIGIGSGSGIGRGRGIGRGIGIGRGSGIGRGIGIGSGSGRGIGSGIGIGIGMGKGKETQMEPGKRYLILTVDWYAWCGRMIRQVAPYEYEFEFVSKFDTNAGDVFGEVAANEGRYRAGCTFQHFKGKAILGLGRVAVFEWVGKLPQE